MDFKGLKGIPHNGSITIDTNTNNNITTSTKNPFSVSSYL